jgi:hypothetical protein
MTNRLFSYGTLQQADLQKSLFGEEVPGRPDRLPAYRLALLAITDPEVTALSGAAEHPIAQYTGDPADYIDGTVLELTDAQLAAADDYEVDDYTRAVAPLASGVQSWVYAASHSQSPEGL